MSWAIHGRKAQLRRVLLLASSRARVRVHLAAVRLVGFDDTGHVSLHVLLG
jgi:hypothetical protein